MLLYVIHTAMNQHMPLRKLSRKQTSSKKAMVNLGFIEINKK